MIIYHYRFCCEYNFGIINPRVIEHILMPTYLSVLLNTGRGIGTETCALDTVFPLSNHNLLKLLKAAYYVIRYDKNSDALKYLDLLL